MSRDGEQPPHPDTRAGTGGTRDRHEPADLDGTARQARESAERAETSADRAEGTADQSGGSAHRAQDAADTAEQARQGAQDAGRASVEAAAEVAPDDPLLDEAARKIEAHVDEDNPYGHIGRPISRRSPLWIGFTAALGVALAYALVQAISAVRSILVLVLVSAFLAVGLDPAVRLLERRRLPRGRAVATVVMLALLLLGGLGAAVVPPIVSQGQQLVDAAPGYLSQLADNPRIAQLDQRYRLLDRAQAALADPTQLGGTLLGGLVGVGRVVVGAFFSVTTVVILTLYFLANLPAMKDYTYRLVPRSRRARVGLITDEILTRVGGYVAGALTIATIAGSTTFVVLLVVGVPFPLALALLVAVTDLIPLIGATIGAVLVTLVALTVSIRTGIVVGVWYLAYQQVENYLIYPRIMKRSVDVSPAATIVAVLIGGSLLGIVGALVAIPLTAAVQLIVHEVVVPRQDAA